VLWQKRVDTGVDIIAYITIHWTWFPILLGSWWILAWFNDLYDIPSSVYRVLSTMRIMTVAFLGSMIYLVTFFLIPNVLPRLFFIYFLLITLVSIVVWRWTYSVLFSITPLRYRILIVGKGERGRSIVRVLSRASRLNYHVLGYVDDAPVTPDDALPVLGQLADLPHLVQNLRVNEIVLALEGDLDKDLFCLLIECQARGVSVSLMPDLYEKLYHRIPIEYIDPSWALHVMQGKPVFSRLQLSLKRLLDLVSAIVGLVILLPILPLVALIIRLESAGPIFYRQVRCGRAGKLFSIIKFRTMYSDAEQDGKARWAAKNDARITRVGRFLRKSRLDELPQLFNVLRGEMSIIGPRPERPEFVEELEQAVPFYQIRLMIKPGLTGWAQIHYDYGNSVTDALIKLQYDFYYLRYWSIWLDLYIIFKTIGVVLKFKGI
jgi:exopolysaccharide biosynthesis polyprenyl glycosylphosphotransferase